MDTPASHERTTTNTIDSLRSANDDIVSRVRETISHISRIDTPTALQDALKSFFKGGKNKVLRDFFLSHPIRWIDLLRKIHKSRKNNNERWWYIDDSGIADIYASFIIRWRKADTWSILIEAIPRWVLENSPLIDFASKQKSILDSSWYSFSRIPINKRKWDIRKLIELWLIQNIKWCNYDSLDIHFHKVFPKLIKYIEDIFWIRLNLWFCNTIMQLSHEVEKIFSSWQGGSRENAFRLIQAFHAWSNIEEIEKIHNDANSIIGLLPKTLTSAWLVVKDITEERMDEWVILYSWNVKYNWKECKINWRVKTVQSLLQKMWDKEEYTNIDAIRDVVGISITYPGDTSNEDKVKIISSFAKIMPNYWYLLKDKWEIWDIQDSLLQTLRSKEKNPIHTTRKKTDYTDPDLRNASMSGYTRIWSLDIGCEIQFSTEAASEWKKKDDTKYKPKWAISAFLRWPRIETPQQIYNLLNKRISAWNLRKLGFPSINALMLDMVKSKFLKPYVSSDGSIMLLSCEWRDKYIWGAFTGLWICSDNSHRYFDTFSQLIDTLSVS